MKTLSIITLVFLCLSVKAQQITKEVDQFTGDTSIRLNTDTLSKYVLKNKKGKIETIVPFLTFHSVRVNRKNGKVYQFMFFNFSAKNVLMVSEINNAIFKLANDSVFKVAHMGKGKVYRTSEDISFGVNIDKDLISKFTNNEVVAIRFETSTGNYDYTIDDDKRRTISSQILALNPQ